MARRDPASGEWLPDVATKQYVDGGLSGKADASHDHAYIPSATQTITDWNAITVNQFSMAANAANGPSATKPSWWYGWQVTHNPAWMTQFALPFSQAGIDGNVLSIRHKQNGTWTAWSRLVNYGALSWDTLDNFLFLRHGGNAADASVSAQSVWAIGNKKDTASAAITANEQFRIQRYDTSGTYAGNLMTGTMAGVVNFPGGHSRTMEALDAATPVEADRVATVGLVVEIVARVLDALGVTTSVTPAGGQTLLEAIREAVSAEVNLAAATAEYDPAQPEGS